jgi:glutamate-1-semialdehyde aminotransferase
MTRQDSDMCGHIGYSHTNAHIDRTLEAAEDVLKELANVPARVRDRGDRTEAT